MLSTVSGFTPGQAQRFKAMFYVLVVGLLILVLGVGILCFGRMYGFDSSRYDLYMVFGIIIVLVAVPAILAPVYCQVRIYLEVRQEEKSDAGASGNYGPVFITGSGGGGGALGQTGTYAATGTYQYSQHQPLHARQMPFSSAAYMVGQKQTLPTMQPMLSQGSGGPGSVAFDDSSIRKQDQAQARSLGLQWPSDKQQQQPF